MKKITPYSYKMVVQDLTGGRGKGFEIYVPALKAYIFGDTIKEALKGYFIFFKDEVEYRKENRSRMPKPDIDS